MNWQKYSQLLAENPELGPCFAWHIGPGALKTGGHPDFANMREWVESQVGFVAIKPFDALDLDAENEDRRNDPVKGSVHVHYTVWFQIDGNESICGRCRSLNNRNDDESNYGYTVREVIEHSLGWHSLYWAKQANRPLVINAVTRHKKWQRREDRYVLESLEIFRVPTDFLQPLM